MKNKNDNRAIPKPLSVLNEFEGFEIEEKFNLQVPYRKSLLNKFTNVLIQSGDFIKQEGYGDFSWVFDFDYYGFKKGTSFKQAFILIDHPTTPKFWVRKKLQGRKFAIWDKQNEYWVWKRREITSEVHSKLTNSKALFIIEQESNDLRRKIIFIGKITREKHYVYLFNKKSGRTYAISLDLCLSGEARLSQLEIEYKWISKRYYHDRRELKVLLSEFLQMSMLIIKSCSKDINPASQTKFEWLTGRIKNVT